MFGIGFPEILLATGIALVVLGPERLPVAARTLGRWVGRGKHMVASMQQQINDEVNFDEIKKEFNESTIVQEIKKADLGFTEIKPTGSTKSGDWPGMPPPDA